MSLRAKFVSNIHGEDVVERVKSSITSKGAVMSLQKITCMKINKKKNLYLHGVDEHGLSVCCKITNFQPSFLIRSLEMWDVNDESAEEELSEFVESLNDSMRHFEGGNDKIVEYSFCKLMPFIGFTNGRKDRLVKMVCSNIYDFGHVTSHLKKNNFEVIHGDFGLSNQFLQQRNISYGDWIHIKNSHVYVNEEPTYSNINIAAETQNISKFEGVELPIAPFLKAYIRCKAVSRDGASKKNFSYVPDPILQCDRLVAIGVDYVWSFQHDGKPAHSEIFSTFSASDRRKNSNDVTFTHCLTESLLLEYFQKSIQEFDPDDLFYYPDQLNTLCYFAERCKVNNCERALALDRFRGFNMKVQKSENRIFAARTDSRTMFNIEASFKRKVFILFEAYDLYTVSCMGAVRKSPRIKKDLITDVRIINRSIHGGNYDKIFEVLLQDMILLRELDKDAGLRMEFSNVSRVSDTDLTDVVLRGEQIRVFNKMTAFALSNGAYVNKSKLNERVLRFPIASRRPTYEDPGEMKINKDYRQERVKEYVKLQNYKQEKYMKSLGLTRTKCVQQLPKTQNDDGDTEAHANDGDVKEGGSVLQPSPGFYGKDRIFVLDFASLYPSIMERYCVSYENVVYDKKYLDLPGVEYVTVQITKYETVVVAQKPGIIGSMLRMLINSRNDIKKKMKSEKDPFRKKIYDFEQNSMKVLCNATYGFCGAETGDFLPMKEVMYIVTSLGRYLQKESARYCAEKYKVLTIYGDTDSIFVKLVEFTGKDIQETCSMYADYYDMGTWLGQGHDKDGKPMTWPNLREHYLKRGLDIDTFEHEHKLNAIMYVVAEKLSDEVSKKFGGGIILELENMATEVWMGNVKKCYYYSFWDEKNPTKIKKVKVTGMARKTRAWCLWSRKALTAVADMINKGEFDKIRGYLVEQLNRMIDGRVPMEDLTITKNFTEKVKYKNFRGIHLQVLLKEEKRNRWPQTSNTRIPYVVVQGDEKIYNRGENPTIVEENNIPLDHNYYIEKQFYKPMKKLLVFHPHLFDFEDLYQEFILRLHNKKNNIFCGDTNVKSKRLSMQERAKLLQERARKKRKMEMDNNCNKRKC